ncbi:MAG: DUF4249 family protein [Bacteroidota bacterium]
MRRSIFLLSIMLMALASQQCYYRLDHDEFGAGGILGVNSFYTPDSVWSFDIFLTQAVLDTTEVEIISEVDIRIWADGELVVTSFTRNGNRFFSDYYPELEVAYRVEIEVPGHPILSSETQLTTPIPPPAVSFSYADSVTTDWGQTYFPLGIEVTDPAGQNDLYKFEIEGQGTFVDDRRDSLLYNIRWGIFLWYPPEEDGQTWLSGPVNLSPEDGSTTLYELIWNRKDYFDFEENRYRLSIRQYGQEFITYNNSITQQNFNESNPYTQPTQVYTNVAGGVGIIDGFHRFYIPLE